MKIVFFVKRFYTGKDLIEDRFGRLFYFPKILAEMGHECDVIALDTKNSAAIDIRQDDVRFRTLTKRSFWRLLSPARLCSKFGLSDVDLVFSSGDSYYGYLGLRLARHLSAKAVFDIYDDYAHFGSNKLPFMRSMLTSAASESDLLVCASEPIRHAYSALQANAVLLQNGVDNNIFAPIDKKSDFIMPMTNMVTTGIILSKPVHLPHHLSPLTEQSTVPLAGVSHIGMVSRNFLQFRHRHDHFIRF